MSGSRVIRGKEGSEFSVHWTTVPESSDAGRTVQVAACDGDSVWSCTVDGTLKPKSQNLMSAVDFVASIPFALKASASQYVIDISVDRGSSPPTASLTIKKKIDNSTSQLMWCKAVMHCAQGVAAVMRFMTCLVDMSATQQRSLDELTAANATLTSSLKTLADDFQNYREEQEGFNKTILTKTCMLLNTKKSEIRRLQSEIEGGKERMSASQSTGESQPIKKPPVKRRKITGGESDESGSLEEAKTTRKETVPRARSSRIVKAKKPDCSLSQSVGEESEHAIFCKSGSIEITGAELETVLSQQAVRPNVESGTEFKSVLASQSQRNQVALDTQPKSHQSASSMTVAATEKKGNSSQSRGRVQNSLSQLINTSSEEDDDGVSSYLY